MKSLFKMSDIQKLGDDRLDDHQKDIDTTNKWLVSVTGESEISLLNPRATQRMTSSEALTLAAWLVCMAERDRGEFQDYLDAVADS